MTSNIRYGTPTGLYLIIEQVHAKPGMPSFGNTIGPSITQIYRVVLQIHDLHDTYLDGKPVTGKSLSPWQLVKGSLGIGISTRPNGARSVKLEYAGFTNLVQPLPALGDLIPETLTKQRAFASRSPYIFGVGLAACKRLALSAVAAANARTWLTVIVIAAPVFSFLDVRMRTSTFTGLTDTTGISMALTLADIPLYQIGVLPGLGVLAYTIALGVVRPHRNHA